MSFIPFNANNFRISNAEKIKYQAIVSLDAKKNALLIKSY